MPRATDKERELQERAERYMLELEKRYSFLRNNDSTPRKRAKGPSEDAAAIEALTEISEKLRA